MIESFTFDIPGEFGGTKNASWSSVRVFPPIFTTLCYAKLRWAMFCYEYVSFGFFSIAFVVFFSAKILFSLTLWMKEFSEWVIFFRARVPLRWVWQLSTKGLLWNDFWTLCVGSCYVGSFTEVIKGSYWALIYENFLIIYCYKTLDLQDETI